MDEQDHECVDVLDPEPRGKDGRYSPTKESTDTNHSQNSPADSTSDWRNRENHSSEDPGEPKDRKRYNPTGDSTDIKGRAELSRNWRSTGDHSSEDPVRADKPKRYNLMGDSTDIKGRAEQSSYWRSTENHSSKDPGEPKEHKRNNPTGDSTDIKGRAEQSSYWRSTVADESDEDDKELTGWGADFDFPQARRFRSSHDRYRQSRGQQHYHSNKIPQTVRDAKVADESDEDDKEVTGWGAGRGDFDFPQARRFRSSQNRYSKSWGQPHYHSNKIPGTVRDASGKEPVKAFRPRNYSTPFRSKEAHNHGLNNSESGVARILDLTEITAMAKLESPEIIMKLASPGNGLKRLVNDISMDHQLLESFLEVLNKAIGCITNRQNLIHLLSEVLGSPFLKQVLPSHILQWSATQQETFTLTDHILDLLIELISIFPSSSFTEVTIVKTLLQKVINESETNEKTFSEETKQKLTTLDNFLHHVQDKKQEGTLKSDNYIYIAGKRAIKEDEDFRNMSVFPTYKDIHLNEKTYMRCNVINDSYPDAKSYLSTHFHLLREDFIRPLKDGISQLLSSAYNEKFDDIRVYFGTQIVASLCIQSGIVHQVKFCTSNLKHVRWESSQRLLYGALVCLSKDNFQNMLFATVAERSVSDLQMGVITLMFTEESREKLFEHTPDDKFVMVETTAYFESYRHTLEGLKEMLDNEIPFQNYIVHCDTTVSAPIYLLQRHSEYTLKNLSTLHIPSEKQIHSGDWTVNIGTNIQQELTSQGNTQTKPKFDIFDFNTWPTKEELALDSSQFEAFQKALTSELSIIQGPPGTGKTYVGLKIVHALLDNRLIWKQGDSPILIVCYTNHALDQFLEGIYKYSKCKIVRVGSRSNSALMQRFSLSVVRKSHYGCFPAYLERMRTELEEERKTIQRKLNEKKNCLNNAFKGILHENVLKDYINPFDFSCLISEKKCIKKMSLSSAPSIMAQWLGVAALFKNKTNANILARRDAELWAQENMMHEYGECATSEEKADDSIKVSEEPERALYERSIEPYFEDNELQRLRLEAKYKQKDILVFIPTHKDQNDKDTKHGDWEVSKEMKRKMRNRIKSELQNKDYMDEVEYEQIADFWALPIFKRWSVYRLWRNALLPDIHHEIFELENKYQVLINRLTEIRYQEDVLILQKADIIGMTTTGAAKYRGILQNIRPQIVVVEEAAEVLEAHIIATLSSNLQHLILIGDHQQLRPTTMVYELAKNFNLEVSMFERLIKRNLPYVRLNYQHRMRPEIARLLTPHIYDQLENHESVYQYDNIKGVGSNLFFVDHNHLEEHIQDGKSHQNVHEAAFVKSLCLYFIHQDYKPSQITILTTYSGQLHCLQKMMPKSKFEGVRVCVVDKYQGEENDIIILSLVRSNLEGKVGFLKIPNRVCVALSRAKKGLFCIGNMQLLSKFPLWSKINDVLKENGQIGREMKLQCENHHDTLTYVSSSEDFSRVPEGGCMIPCEYRLDCGHVCTLICHPYDQEHKTVVCNKPCLKVICEKGHKCNKRCSEPCEACNVLVQKEIKICGHIQDVPCHSPPYRYFCKVPCTKSLKCGHKCGKLCPELCTDQCKENVSFTLLCGHTITTLCHLRDRDYVSLECTLKCQDLLTCNQTYLGPCNICFQFHMDGTKQADILIGSYLCEEKCCIESFCCTHLCENTCIHCKCVSLFSEPCSPCTFKCLYSCPHRFCKNLCWKPCDRKTCDEPCYKKLKCGHSCIGLCGEPCPVKCRICDVDEVTKYYFGKEAEPQARFVQLMDCPHFFEVTKFTEWMNQKDQDQVIKLKSCPKCSKTIRKSFRYGNLIKQTFSDIEVVKERIVTKWLAQLEEYLSVNEAVLKHISEASKIIDIIKVNKPTIPHLILWSEKCKVLIKLGTIKSKLQDFQNIPSQINSLVRQILHSRTKYSVLEIQKELFKLVNSVHCKWLKGTSSDLPVDDTVDASIKVTNSNHIEDMHVNKQTHPALAEIITLMKDQKSVIDTAILKQDHWHKCSAGHIYTSREDKENLFCPECSHDIDEHDDRR